MDLDELTPRSSSARLLFERGAAPALNGEALETCELMALVDAHSANGRRNSIPAAKPIQFFQHRVLYDDMEDRLSSQIAQNKGARCDGVPALPVSADAVA